MRRGNERVIRPRFADAAFFWKQDLRQPLDAFLPRLDTVVFQERLGTLGEKSRRVALAAGAIARELGLDVGLAERSALLAKCDLMTHMIFEFPSLQGVMGRYYAERSGEDPCVAAATEDRFRVMSEICAGLMPVRQVGQTHIWFTPWDYLIRWWGIAEAMLDFHDRPDLVHRLLRRFWSARNAILAQPDFWMPVLYTRLKEGLIYGEAAPIAIRPPGCRYAIPGIASPKPRDTSAMILASL